VQRCHGQLAKAKARSPGQRRAKAHVKAVQILRKDGFTETSIQEAIDRIAFIFAADGDGYRHGSSFSVTLLGTALVKEREEHLDRYSSKHCTGTVRSIRQSGEEERQNHRGAKDLGDALRAWEDIGRVWKLGRNSLGTFRAFRRRAW